jgi:hypothetical protein
MGTRIEMDAEHSLGVPQCTRLLIDHEADANAKNNSGESAMYRRLLSEYMSYMASIKNL